MSDFEIGKVVEGTTLVPMFKYPDGYGCTCTKCHRGNLDNGFIENGISMRYTKHNLVVNKQSCRYCKFLAKMQKNIVQSTESNIENIDMLLEKERRIGNGELNLVRVGDSYIATVPTYEDVDTYMKDFGKPVGDLKVMGYIGKFKKITLYGIQYSKPTHIVLVCPICHTRKVVEYTSYTKLIRDSHTCVNDCKNKLSQIEEQKRLKMTTVNKAKRIEEQKQLSAKGITLLGNSTLSKFKASNKYASLVEKIGNRYPNHEIMDIELTKEPSGKKSYDTIIVCKLCGSIMSVGSSERTARKCPCAESPLLRGRLKQNYVNTVHNGLIVTEQLDNFKCNVKCFHCGNEMKDLSLYDVINDKYCCSCYEYEDLCDSCGAPVRFNVRGIFEGKKCSCEKCGESADTVRIMHDIKLENTKFTFSRLHNGTARGMQPISATFLKDKDALYTGTNGIHYYRCFCMEHNKDLILTSDESKSYNHEKCTGLRLMNVKKVLPDDFKNIRV